MPFSLPPLPPFPRPEIPWPALRALARTRLFLARHRVAYWFGVGAVACVAAATVQAKVDALDSARDAWGETRTVLVADRDLEPGEALDGAVSSRALPVAALPADVMDHLDAGAVALHPLGAGEALAAHHVAPGTGLAASLPAGTAGVVVPLAGPGPRLALGDLVDVVLVDDPLGATVADPAIGDVLGEAAVIVDVVDSAVVVAVPDTDAPRVAAAAAAGRAVLVVRRAPATPPMPPAG